MTTVVLALAVLVALAVAVRVGLRVLARPQRGVLLILFIVPFDGLLLLVDLPGVVAGWKEALTLGTFLATFVAPQSARAPQGRRMPAWVGPAVGLALIAAVWLVVQGPSALIGFKITFFFLLIPLILWRCPFNAQERDQMVTMLMVSSFVVAMVGIAQQMVGADFLVSLGYEWNTAIRTTRGLLRSIGTFEQPFPFAFFVMTALAVSIPVALDDLSRTRNRLYLLAAPLVVLGMATAIVRGAFIGLGAALLITAIYRYRVLVHLLAPLFIVMILLSGQIGSALFSSSSLFERTDRWEDVFSRAVENPFGAGLTASGAAQSATLEAPIKVAETFSLSSQVPIVQPDNYYLKVLVDLGLPGMWLVILMVVFALTYAWRIMRTANEENRALAAGICAAMGAAATAALVSTYWEIFPAELLYWMLLGVLPSLDPSLPSTHSPSGPTAAASRPTFASSSGP